MKKAWVKARVREASDRGYLDLVLTLLGRARKGIILSMYLIEPGDETFPAHPVSRLLDALLAARSRGAAVRLLLNSNFRYLPKKTVAQGRYFERLLQAGAELTTLLPSRRLHDKLIVIDSRWVIEGSTNWSLAALLSNYESATVIDSPALAAKKLERLRRLMVPVAPEERSLDQLFRPVPETVEIPIALLEKGPLAEMVSTSDIRAMDLYLILAGQAAASGKKELTLDLETTGRALGLPAGWGRSIVRRQIIKVLRKLADRYQLLSVEFPYAQNARVTLRESAGEKVTVPGYLLEPQFLAKESSGTVFLAMAREILKKEGADMDSLSAPELEKRFGIGASTVVRSRRR